jgi:enoyl-CoA hydratase/carnithine racemase
VQVVIENQGPVKTIRLARPEKKNALTAEMYDALTGALREAAADDAIRVVLLIGAPGVFTAGNDLSDFLQHPPAGEESPVFRFLSVLTRFEKALVAAVDGPAVGIGTTLLLHCDLVVAATGARFQLPFVKLGLVPEAASSYLLPRLAGMQRASEWLLLGEPFSAADAHAAGLVNRVVAAEALEQTARGFAEALAARPPEALRLSKKLIRGPRAAEVQSVMDRESALFVERLSSEEAREAFLAFLSKKKG